VHLLTANSGLVVTDFAPPDLGGVKALVAEQGGGCLIASTDLYRLNARGEVDTNFGSSLVLGNGSTLGAVFDLQVDPQGRILMLGSIPIAQGTQGRVTASVVRFEADGRLDTSFTPVIIKASEPVVSSGMKASDVWGSTGFKAVQTSTGEMWVGGDFSLVNGLPRQGLAKLSANGTLLPVTADPSIALVSVIARYTGDRIVVAYSDPNVQASLAVLKADGSIDPSFPVCRDWSSISVVYTLSSGRLLVCGGLSGTYKKCGRIYGPDGVRLLDIPFVNEQQGLVLAAHETSAGKILLSGTQSDPVTGMTVFGVNRFLQDGSRDETWTPLCIADGKVWSFSPTTNGDVFIRGAFKHVEGIESLNMALLSDHPSPTSAVSNISSNTYVDSQRPSILGFVVQGRQAVEVVLRAVGPSLASFGNSSVLKNPSLELYKGAVRELASEGWSDDASLRQLQSRCGAFPLLKNSRDCVVHCVLAPGPHTIIVHASGGDAGNVLCELYSVE